jgi:hypothetical protein
MAADQARSKADRKQSNPASLWAAAAAAASVITRERQLRHFVGEKKLDRKEC